MLLTEIEEEVKSGKLVLVKTNCGTCTRRLPTYSKIKGEIIAGTFFGDFEKYKTITYPRIFYRAVYKGTNRGYRISKKVYQKLSTDKAGKLIN
jgi:hypothetical protein